MTRAELISIVALLISLGSAAATIYFNLRDRARLVVKSTFYSGYDGEMPSMTVSVVNGGRRPAVLRMWAGTDGTKHWAGTLLNSSEGGLRLAEHERYELRLSKDDLTEVTPDHEIVFTDLWFEDTLGRRHFVVDAKKHIAMLRREHDAI